MPIMETLEVIVSPVELSIVTSEEITFSQAPFVVDEMKEYNNALKQLILNNGD